MTSKKPPPRLPPRTSGSAGSADGKGKGKPRGRPFQKGEDPRRGHGPAPGAGSAPTMAFVIRMKQLADRPVPEDILDHVRWLFGPDNKDLTRHLIVYFPAAYLGFLTLAHRCWKDAADRGHGRPTLPIEVDIDLDVRRSLRDKTDAELIDEVIRDSQNPSAPSTG